MKNYIYLIAVLLVTLGLAVAILNERLQTLESDLQIEFERFERERMSL